VSDSLTEELIRSLVSIGNLNVIGRSSVFQFKTGDGDSRTVGKSLGVDYVLEGTLRINNGRIQITAKLIHVQRAWILWSEKYACDWSGILSIQDQITASVTDALKIRVSALDGTTLFAHVTEQPEAYADYLRGRYFWNQRTPTALRASIHFYEKAIERDASCGPAYAGIASTLTTIAINDQEPTLAIADRARAAAQRALELRPDWAEALAAMGCVHSIFDWNWKDAALHFEEAIRRQPGSSAVHYLYAIFNLTPTGRWSEAIGLMEEALRLDPISPLLFRDLGLIHFMRHAFQEAESAWQQAELLVPGYLGCLYWRARLQMETGEFGEAMRDLEKRFACGGDLIIACWPLSVMPQRDWVMWTELYRY
jgi:adenylate cyclase